MSPLDGTLLAERTLAVTRHLARVAAKLPTNAEDLRVNTDEADTVILHLWQATQIVIDLAVSASVALGGGTPTTYGDAFRRLAASGIIEAALADRLARAAGFRNLVAHAYGQLDMRRVYEAASIGPADLRAFLAAVSRHVSP